MVAFVESRAGPSVESRSARSRAIRAAAKGSLAAMERSLFRYIWHHTWRDQVLLLVVTVASLPLIYVNLELPKRIVNDALGGKRGFPVEVLGREFYQLEYLMLLSLALLALITINGAIKYWLNVYRGVVGERMVRRLRYQLYEAMLRFPLPHFKKTSSGEIIPMVTAETDPIGGFIGESIASPAFQLGLLVTYMTFIFMQNFWLGLAAVALYPPQAWLIPKLQRKINQLAKRRIQTTREFSDRIGDVIGGVTEVRANDTMRYELADASNRLGTIYGIRVDIYKRKFFVKFLNNFLAQVTPFFFYAIGGYFVIQGQLTVGALVAVIAAYKDIIDPWKELLNWYATKEDVRVKYEQIVEQFEPPGMLPDALVSGVPASLPRLEGPIVASGLRYDEDGAERIASLDVTIPHGERVAVVGAGDSAKDDVARLLARLAHPSAGRLTIGAQSLPEVHVAVTGSRIAYASRNAHVFSGTLFHNLLYGLKHRQVRPATYEGEAARAEEARRRDAVAAGNTTDDIGATWIDVEVTGVEDAQAHGLEVLRVVAMDEELFGFGLSSRGAVDAGLEALVLDARVRLRDRVRSPDLAPLVELFDRDRYIENATIAENLLFGAAIDPAFAPDRLAANHEVRRLLDDMGLTADLEAAGIEVAKLMIELFANEPPDSPLFAEYSFISPEDLGDFRALLRRLDDKGRGALPARSREMLLSLPLKLVAARHRLGIPDASLQQRLVAARQEFARRFSDRGVVEFADPGRFSPALSVRDNILFGRPVYEQARAQERLTDLVREVAREVGMEAALIRRGLDYDVGASGARLSYSQKQRLAIARALIKNPDLLVLDEPTSGLDTALERRVVAGVLDWARGRTVVWALGHAALAANFDRVLVLEQGHLVEDGPFDRLAKEGRALPKLLA